MTSFIDANFDCPLDLVRALASRARTRPARRVRQAGQEGRLVLRRRAAATHLQLPVDVRRAGPVRGARPVRRHHLHGLRRRGVRARGRHAPDGRRAGRRGREGRGRHPLLVAGHAHRPRFERPRDRRGDRRIESGSPPTPSCATPTCRSPTGSCSTGSTRRGLPGRASTRRRACCGSRGQRAPAGRGQPPQHPLRR